MKREQKAFAMLMAACMAFAGISTISTASADSFYPTSFEQVQLGNYLPDEDAAKEVPNEIVLPSGRKVIKKSTNILNITALNICCCKHNRKYYKKKCIKLPLCIRKENIHYRNLLP